MLYRPNFCCHCGEKIARSRWLPWTSRRFCEFCQVEQMQHELLPKVAALIAVLIGAAGMVSYLGSAAGSGAGTSAKIRRLSTTARQESNTAPSVRRTEPANPPALSQQTSNTGESTKLQREALPESSTEPVYYCGAKTRKGTPCTRRLKTKGRCWQHAGQPLAEDERKHSLRP